LDLSQKIEDLRSNFDVRALMPFATRITTGALSYGIFAFAARTTDQPTFNHFAFIFSLVHVVGPLAVLGQTTVALKYLPLLATNDLASIADQMSHSLQRVLFGVFAGTFVVIVILWLQDRSGLVIIAIVCSLVAVYAFNDYLSASRRALGSIAGSIVSRDVVWRLVMFGCLGFAFVHNQKIQIDELLGILLVGLLVSLGTLTYPLMPIARAQRTAVLGRTPASEWIVFIGLTGLDIWFSNADVIMLNFFNIDAGSYFVAHRTATLLYLIPSSMTFIAMPHITQAFHSGNIKEVEQMSRKVSRSAGVLIGLCVVILFGCSPLIMSLFGARFVKDAYLLDILSIDPLVNSLGGLCMSIAVLCGMQRRYFGSLLIVVGMGSIAKIIFASAGRVDYFAAVNIIQSLCMVFTSTLMLRRIGVHLRGPLSARWREML
jgi:O-antigen/teichoic acid export membrane protein